MLVLEAILVGDMLVTSSQLCIDYLKDANEVLYVISVRLISFPWVSSYSKILGNITVNVNLSIIRHCCSLAIISVLLPHCRWCV
jgi:hypothetical protein